MKLCVRVLCFFVWMLSAVLPAFAQGQSEAVDTVPLVGSRVINKASASYTYAGYTVRIDSNQVVVNVAPVEGLALIQNNTRQVPAGASLSLPHRLTNTGNVETTYVLNYSNSTNDDYDLADLTLLRDLNGNGIADGGEPEIASGGTLTLAAGQFADLVIRGRVPAAIPANQIAGVNIKATSQGSGLTATNVDTVRVGVGTSIDIRKGASPSQATRGSLVTFDITTVSRGGNGPSPIDVVVDGGSRQLVIVRDEIPANTTFDSIVGEENAFSTPLYHRLGDSLHTYTTTPSGTVDAVAWGLTELQPERVFRAYFRVSVHNNASSDIRNIARIYYLNGQNPEVIAAPSNPVQIQVPSAPPTLEYYTGPDYQRVSNLTGVGRPLYLQGNAAECNQNPLEVDRTNLTIRSTLTGDIITVVAVETGPNTGIFRVENPVPTSGDAANSSDDVLQIMRDDSLVARLSGCGTADAVTRILVDPFGVVFNARNNEPVAGARVTLVDAVTGQPAQVFDFDGVTPRSSSVVTGADGRFEFPQVAPGNYRFVVEAPQTYTFPSRIRPANMPPGRTIDASGSYGGSFTVPSQLEPVTIDIPLDSHWFKLAGNGKRTTIRTRGINGSYGGSFTVPSQLEPVTIDIPLDPELGAGLFIEKTALVRDAEIGSTVDYSITIRNISDVNIDEVRVSDVLPLGFSYVRGTARLDGKPQPDPEGLGGRNLNFNIGMLKLGAETVLRYRLIIGPGTKSGKNVNRAQAIGKTPFDEFVSNRAQAEVEVQGGVFTTRGIIFGKVWVDADRDGVQDKNELVVPGARIFLEDGTYAVTDSDGKWSIYGALPVTHTVKIDTTTLPRGAVLSPLTTMYARSGTSVFADLKNGEMQKVNFALITPTDDVLTEVKKRLAAGEPSAPELNSRLDDELEASPRTTITDVRAQAATGVISGNGVGTTNTTRQTTAVAQAGIDGRPRRTANDGPLDGNFGPVESPSVPAQGPTLEDVLPELNGEAAILNLKEGDVLLSDQINVRVGGGAEANLQLSVNGEALGDNRVGTRTVDSAKGVQALEYIGVKLRAGANALRLTQKDQFGNVRGDVSINVIAPGNLGRVQIVLPKNGVGADGQTVTNIGVTLVDGKGVPVTARTPLTLEATAGTWKATDLNKNEPGTQVFIEGGKGEFALVAPFEPGRARVRVSAGTIQTEGEIAFVPYLRPVVAAGIFEGQFGFNARGISKVPTGAFERELEALSSGSTGGRAAGYVKGRIQGKYLLSMRFDSQDREDERLFRDIQPDEFYPVYGDSSIKGFDAQSTGKLYIRVDKDNSYALYGDFSTYGAGSDALSLSRYSRAFTGTQLHAESEKFTASAFYARDNTERVVREIRANGTSGPYPLSAVDIRPQSERVEIIVRDRNNPGVILRTTAQTRFTDYTLDGFASGLLFRTPIPSFDEDGNPIFIRVTYEAETNGPDYSVTGVSGQYKLNNNLQIGASLVRDQNPDEKMTMGGLNAVYRLSKDTVVIGEWARTDTDDAGQGSAYRVEVRKEGAKVQAQLFHGKADSNFDNPESVLTGGRTETGARISVKAGTRTALQAEAISTKDETGAKSQGIQVAVDHAFSNSIRGSAGIRHGQGDAGATFGGTGTGNIDFTSAFAKINARVPGVPDANVFARYEQELSGDSKSFAIGGDYQLSSRARLYATHEFFDSPLSLYALGDSQRRYGTRFGIESSYAQNASLFSEYRIAGGIDGRSAQAAIGLKNRWRLMPGLNLNTSVERTKNLSNVASDSSLGVDDGTAVSLGLESLSSRTLKWTARAEMRDGNNNDTTLLNAGMAYQPTRSLTLLGRGVFAKTKTGGENANERTQTRIQFGAAYRPTNSDRWNALAKYEYRGGDDPDSTTTYLRRRVHIVSTDLNYQPARTIQARLHYAYKSSWDDSEGMATHNSAHLVSGRVTKDLTDKLNLSLIGSRFWSKQVGTSQNSLGVEAGYLLSRNLLFSLGYNFSELRDPDFQDADLGRGFYMRLRFKFDEDLFNGMGAFQKAPEPSNSKPFVPVTNTPAGGIVFGGDDVAGLESFTGNKSSSFGYH